MTQRGHGQPTHLGGVAIDICPLAAGRNYGYTCTGLVVHGKSNAVIEITASISLGMAIRQLQPPNRPMPSNLYSKIPHTGEAQSPLPQHDQIATIAPSGVSKRGGASPRPWSSLLATQSPPVKRALSRFEILQLTSSMAGIQVCYAAQINLGSSQLQLLGLPEQLVSIAWLAGPISGLVMQPLVGVLSDNCMSAYGRRRPFILGGAIFTALSLLLFSNASQLAHVISPPALATRLALSIAVFSFFLLDFAIQAVQGPLRALVTDLLPDPQLDAGNAALALHTGLGNLAGSLLASVKLSRVVPFFDTDAQALFAAAAAILLVCVLFSLLIPEPHAPRVRTPPSDPSASRGARHWVAVLRGTPRPFWRVFAVQLCTWCGFFALFVYVNTWIGRNVFLGDGGAPAGSPGRLRFDEGVRLGGLANALTAVVTLVYSAYMPALLERHGVLRVYAFSQVVEALSLISAHWIRGTPGQLVPSFWLQCAAVLDIGAFGVVWATTMTVPWTLVGRALRSDESYEKKIGLFTTLFNASQSFPQLVVAVISPFILGVAKDNPAAVMVVGGIVALVGAVLVYALRVNRFDEPRKMAI